MQRLVCGFALIVSLAVPVTVAADEPGDLADALRGLSAQVLPVNQRDAASGLVRHDLRKRIQAANDRSSQAWRKIENRDDWERFRDPHLQALRHSLGSFPDPPKKLNLRVTGRLNGDGFTIENLVYESRPGLWVTANLYVPSPLRESMPGILLSHAHHRPKEQGELQDMGMTWARKGCLVLVPDHLGHGERRQHAFASAKDYAGEFRVSRQDYYFRYDTGMQLHLLGDSLMGWMVWDLMRGVDLLLERKGIDPKRIALLGAVAGGGDPAGVTAALDKRITAAVPFNFGGPQPETVYKLPADAETSFNYAGSGSWESTRNLYRSAADGFLHWVIVGGIAPRGLVYAHEFAWDEPRDPVWKRFQQIYGFYNRQDFLASTHGRGGVRGRPPESTHCTNIGREHRKMIHAAFERWFGITGLPQDEFSRPRDSSELRCMTPDVKNRLKPKRLVDLLPTLAAERIAAARKRLAGKTLSERRRLLQSDWVRVLGPVKPQAATKVVVTAAENMGNTSIERLVLEVEPGIPVPLLLLRPRARDGKATPVVVGIAQSGKEAFLRHRPKEIAKLLSSGITVCLPDLRGTGETKGGNDRGQSSAATARSSTELMLGGTMVGARLRDLRALLIYLRGRDDLDRKRIALWGDSFASVNADDTKFSVPRRVDGRAKQSEPLGGLLVMLGALFENDIHAVYAHGALDGFRSVLASQQVLIPHGVVVPGALTAGDLCDVVAVLAPRPCRLDGLVDGLNRRLPVAAAREIYRTAIASYGSASARQQLSITAGDSSPADWLGQKLNIEH